MKTPSLIGGIGPESTIDDYRSIIALWKEKTGDVNKNTADKSRR